MHGPTVCTTSQYNTSVPLHLQQALLYPFGETLKSIDTTDQSNRTVKIKKDKIDEKKIQ